AVGFFALNTAKQIVYNSGRISRVNNGFFKLDTQSSRFILRSGFPALERSAGEEDPFRLFELDWAAIYWRLAANIRHTNSHEILKTQLPLLSLVKVQPKPIIVWESPLPVEPDPAKQTEPLQLSNEPAVLIYHTHTSESYIPVSGKDHILNQQGDIVKVGERLKQVLEEKYQIKTIHSDVIHDQPPFKESYERSLVTVKKMLKKYPSLQILIDLHRDATPGINAVCSIKKQPTATILIVVGSDQMLPHPNWKKNHAFALRVADTMNLYYPGLNSGVIVSKGRYNQHLHERSLIFEFGDHNSTLQETYRSVEVFAEVLALTLKKEHLTPGHG
ncbi:MAG TPA: stage II sporulation protein P, partial [Bacillota bacterium]|nr:stage II sporulation protein P [Bacillota bacterium]